MKKFLLSIVGICLCAICAFSTVGCKPTDYGTTTTSTTNVIANGGSSVVYNGNLYFVNGIGTNDGQNNGGTIGSIYKVAIDAEGKIAKDATYTKVVDALVGYNKGSINIIGDFLYYTTAGTGENKNGEVLYNKTQFMRKNLTNGKTQEIYKSAQNSADEAVTFAYYKTGDNKETLNLVVYEATSKTLKSFKIGNKIEEVFSKENITSAVFSDSIDETAGADNFVFYTLSAQTNAVDTSTNRVYRIGADGSNEALISDNANLTLEGVKAGKLIVTATVGSDTEKVTNTYALPINGDFNIPSVADSDKYVICRNDYDKLMYITDADGNIAILYLDGNNLIYEKFTGNTSSSISYIIHTFSVTPTLNFIGTFIDANDNNNGYVVFTNKESSKNHVYKIRYTFVTEDKCLEERKEPEQLTTSNVKVEESSSSSDAIKLGNMQAKIVGNNDIGYYVYVFVTDEDDHVLLHRVNVYTPKELNEQNPPEEDPTEEELKITNAELIGGPEI